MRSYSKKFAIAALSLSVYGGGQSLALAAPSADTGTKFTEKMKKWQNEMSEKFRDTYRNLRNKFSSKSSSTPSASFDLREQRDSYLIRLNLPGRDLSQVEVTLSGNELRIVAPAEAKADRYEQTLTLSGAGLASALKVERKTSDSLIVVTVPKSPTASAEQLLPLTENERAVTEAMKKMQKEMDELFAKSFQEFRLLPEYKGFFDEPSFGASFDIQTEGANYVVRAYLPERETANVEVSLVGRVLKIEAKRESTENKATRVLSNKAHYVQSITLPGPVHADKMKFDRKEGMVVVTVPMAKTL